MRPLWRSSLSPSAVTKPPKAMFWTMIPGIRKSTYVVARRGDRPAEDVDEEQHEHHRLHREGDQQVGRAREAHQVALGDHQRVGHQPPHAAFSSSSSCRLGRVAGERQEHVVQGRDGAARGRRRRRRRRRAGGPPRRSSRCAGGPSACTVSSSTLGGSSDIGASARTAVSTAPESARWTSRRSPPTRSLSSSGVPSAMTRPRSITAIEVGQAVGLVEVLRGQQHRRALGHQPLDRRPHLQPAARVQAGRGLVEEEHGRAGDERAPRGRAAGACRRSTSWRGGRRRRRGRSARAAPAPRALGRRAALAVEAARPSRGSRGR